MTTLLRFGLRLFKEGGENKMRYKVISQLGLPRHSNQSDHSRQLKASPYYVGSGWDPRQAMAEANRKAKSKPRQQTQPAKVQRPQASKPADSSFFDLLLMYGVVLLSRSQRRR